MFIAKAKVKEKLGNYLDSTKAKVLPVVAGAVGSSAVFAPVCFAADPVTFVVTSDMVAPVFTSITTSATNMLPAGLGVMALMIGIGLIPRMIYKFL